MKTLVVRYAPDLDDEYLYKRINIAFIKSAFKAGKWDLNLASNKSKEEFLDKT